MSVLPTGKPLRQFLSDLDDLLYDPAAYLREGVLAIGPRRVSGFAAVFAVGGVACLVACAVTGRWHDEKLLIGVGLLLGAVVWLGWSLRLRGHELVLHPEGVEVRYRDSVVWCPWALFNADGAPAVPDRDDPRVGLVLPVWPEAVPYAELRRDGAPVAHGAQIRVAQLRFTAPDEVVLPARYEVAAAELGGLLLQLGSRLGRRLPAGTPPPEAYPDHFAPAGVDGPDARGWARLPLSRLRFPPRCCQCGQATDDTLRCHLDANPVTDRLSGVARPVVVVAVPLCLTCRERLDAGRGRGGILGLAAGAVIGLGVALGLVAAHQPNGPGDVLVPGLGGLALGALAGFMTGMGL
jgi:hypothetical protein